LGLTPANDAGCFAADPPAAPAHKAAAARKDGPAPPSIEWEMFLDDWVADAPQKVTAQPSKPATTKPAAKRGSLLGTIVDALGGDRNGNEGRVRVIEDQNIRNMEAQFRPQFQQLLYIELAFLRRVAKPDAKLFAEVAKAAKADLHVPLREYVVSWWGARMNGRGGANAADPRAGMQKLLMPLAEAKLGPDKARLYRQECDKRAEARKHAVVMNVVAALDDRLVLTAPQRAKLVKALSANYEDSWDQFFETFAFSNQNYLPSIRDTSIGPVLDARQKVVWEEAMKLNQNVFFGGIIRNSLSVDATEIQEIAHIVEEVQDGK
jgi:hypothetical protein